MTRKRPSHVRILIHVYRTWAIDNSINPFNPNIKIQILICCPYMFSIEAVGRIC